MKKGLLGTGLFAWCMTAGLLLAALPAGAQTAAPDSGWRFELTPYAWLAGMSGTMGAGSKESHVQADFSQIAQALDSAFMLQFEGRKGRWGFMVDPFYINLSETVMTPYGFKLNVQAKQLIFGAAGSYRAYESEKGAFDVLFGLQYTEVKSGLVPLDVPYPSVSSKKDWLDPMVGFRARVNMGKRWVFGLRGDIGGFSVGSKLAWDAIARFDVKASKSVSFNFGYAVISTDYESGSGDDRFLYDVRMEGPFVGVAFIF